MGTEIFSARLLTKEKIWFEQDQKQLYHVEIKFGDASRASMIKGTRFVGMISTKRILWLITQPLALPLARLLGIMANLLGTRHKKRPLIVSTFNTSLRPIARDRVSMFE